MLSELIDWLRDTWLAGLVIDNTWGWPIAESIHFCGLVMIFGAVSLIDLRVLGLVDRVSFAAVHRLIGIAFVGIILSAATGVTFIAGAADQYFYNAAFHWKLVFFFIALVNLLYFYRIAYPDLRNLQAGESAPLHARVSGCVSLIALIGVMSAGRLLTFFRPSFFG